MNEKSRPATATDEGEDAFKGKVYEGFKKMWGLYSKKALVVYYLDFIFDVFDSFIVEYPQDLIHFFLFFSMIPVRFIGLCLMWCFGCFPAVDPDHDNCVGKVEDQTDMEEGGERQAEEESEVQAMDGVEQQKKRRVKWGNVFFAGECTDEWKNKKLTCLNYILLRISCCGVLIQKNQEKKIYSRSRNHFLFTEVYFQRYDSLKVYMNLLTIAGFIYLWMWYLTSYRDDDFDETRLGRMFRAIYKTTSFEVDVSDLTFICLWAILRIVMNIVEVVVLCLCVAEHDKKEYSTKKKLNTKNKTALGYIFGFQLRKPIRELVRKTGQEIDNAENKGVTDDGEDDQGKRDNRLYIAGERTRIFNRKMANFELIFVKFFCSRETYLKFRRKNRSWEQILSNNMSLHKDVVCLVLAIALSFAVNFVEEHHYVLQFLNKGDCTDGGGTCINNIFSSKCWCSMDMFKDIPTFFLVVGAAVLGVASAMRGVITSIFNIWLQPKLAQRTCYLATSGKNEGQALVIPEEADITEAWYGYLKKEEDTKDNREVLKEGCKTKEIISFAKVCEYYLDINNSINVKEELEYHLCQGTTCFSLEPEKDKSGKENEHQPIMIVKGEWRAGERYTGRIRRMMIDEAVQLIFISKDNSKSDEIKIKCEKKSPIYKRYLKDEERKREAEEQMKLKLQNYESKQLLDLKEMEEKKGTWKVSV